jgi:multidrug efflux pump subunit AcrB
MHPKIVVINGASAETMASTVAPKIEKKLLAIPGVVQRSSSSLLSESEITIQFDRGGGSVWPNPTGTVPLWK